MASDWVICTSYCFNSATSSWCSCSCCSRRICSWSARSFLNFDICFSFRYWFSRVSLAVHQLSKSVLYWNLILSSRSFGDDDIILILLSAKITWAKSLTVVLLQLFPFWLHLMLSTLIYVRSYSLSFCSKRTCCFRSFWISSSAEVADVSGDIDVVICVCCRFWPLSYSWFEF